MDKLTSSPHKPNQPLVRKINTRNFFFLLSGGLFLLYLSITYYYHKGKSIEATPDLAATMINVSPDVNLIGPPLSITPSKDAIELKTPGGFTPEPTVTRPVYYVSPDGIDINPGNFNKPWKTISYAVNKLQAGDSLLIRGGIYQEMIEIKNSGTANNFILISSYSNEEVIIDGNNNSLPSVDRGTPLVSILGNWVYLKNITIRYSGDTGVYAKGEHVTLDNLYVHHNRNHGVVLTGNYDLIQNSRIWYNSTINENNSSTTGNGAGVSCGRYPDYCTIRKSVVWENWGEGIATFEAMHTTIEGNFSYDNQQNFYISDTKYSIMQGNISYCSTGNAIDSYETQNGILVGDEKGVPIPLEFAGTRHSSSDNTFINNIVIGCNHNLAVGTDQSTNNLFAFNTFVDSAGSTTEPYNIIFFRGTATNSRFVNNIIVQEDNRAIAFNGGSGVIFANNIWSKEPPVNVSGEGNIIGDPLLKKNGLHYSPEWFELMDLSPARNKAILIPEVTVDFYGHTRSEPPDIGAIEFISP